MPGLQPLQFLFIIRIICVNQCTVNPFQPEASYVFKNSFMKKCNLNGSALQHNDNGDKPTEDGEVEHGVTKRKLYTK